MYCLPNSTSMRCLDCVSILDDSADAERCSKPSNRLPD